MSTEKRISKRIRNLATAFGLPIPTQEEHDRAVEAMEPFIDEFQRAADEQTMQDLGLASQIPITEALKLEANVGPACMNVTVPETIVMDQKFREAYVQGYRHAVADARATIATWVKALREE